MTRQFSGIQPTGEMHLGNFVGAVKRWVDQQDDGIFCVVDLHAMTLPYEPAVLTAETPVSYTHLTLPTNREV